MVYPIKEGYSDDEIRFFEGKEKYMFYQFKMIRKKSKPSTWRRAFVPSNITFSQMALILEEILEIPKSDLFEFVFLQDRIRIIEWHEEDAGMEKNGYDYLYAPYTYVNEWFERENWFTFRIRSLDNQSVNDPSEYRVEIEKLLDMVAFTEDNTPLNYPVILKEVSCQYDTRWHSGSEINRVLEDRYFLKEREAYYPWFAEALADVEEKHAGIGFSSEMIDRDIHSSDLLRSQMECDVNRSGSTVEEILSVFSREELIEQAEFLNLKLTSQKRNEIVHEIAGYLLTPEVMKGLLLKISEEELDAFEKAMDRGYHFLDEQEMELLDLVIQLNYVAVFTDGCCEVPEEVKEVYSILKKNGYRESHPKGAWMYSCVWTFAIIQVVAPTSILYRMYKQQKSEGSSYQDFIELFHEIPEAVIPCVEKDGRIIPSELEEENLYLELEKHQKEVPYYIPTKDEILSYAKNFYPASEKAYQDLWDFFYEEWGLEDENCDELCMNVFVIFSRGGKQSDFFDQLNKSGIVFETEKQRNDFAALMIRAYNNTRMFEFRGHTLSEMEAMDQKQGLKGNPKIIPMRGMSPDVSEGTGQKPQKSSVKKIYPNDPCPCGSGKKYKNCCGKNKK